MVATSSPDRRLTPRLPRRLIVRVIAGVSIGRLLAGEQDTSALGMMCADGTYCEISGVDDTEDAVNLALSLQRKLVELRETEADVVDEVDVDGAIYSDVDALFSEQTPPFPSPSDAVALICLGSPKSQPPVLVLSGAGIPNLGRISACCMADVETTWCSLLRLPPSSSGRSLLREQGPGWSREEEQRLTNTLRELYGE